MTQRASQFHGKKTMLRKTVIVNKDAQEVKVTLNPLVYPQAAISSAIDAFEPFGATKSGDEILLKPRGKDIDLESLGYEFCDYVLGLVVGGDF